MTNHRLYNTLIFLFCVLLLLMGLLMAAHPTYADPPRPNRPNFPALIKAKYAESDTPLPNPPPQDDCRPVRHIALPGTPSTDCRPVRHDA